MEARNAAATRAAAAANAGRHTAYAVAREAAAALEAPPPPRRAARDAAAVRLFYSAEKTVPSAWALWLGSAGSVALVADDRDDTAVRVLVLETPGDDAAVSGRMEKGLRRTAVNG